MVELTARLCNFSDISYMPDLESMSMSQSNPYRGRLAPTPSGRLHLGHGRTFARAQQRARERQGQLILRIEDLDSQRCQESMVEACIEDLSRCGFQWDEGPDLGGAFGPYRQRDRTMLYREALDALILKQLVYPSEVSRRQLGEVPAPISPANGEKLFPTSLRSDPPDRLPARRWSRNWRLRVPDGHTIWFQDGRHGPVGFVAGVDFGDFLVWRKDGIPSYELAVVVDDWKMAITEVVRGDDLLVSTARQLILYDALEAPAPEWYHCELVLDENGERLSKSAGSTGLYQLLKKGWNPDTLWD